MPQLILLRHGQSRWNLENRFTGWVDVDLSPRGEAEARRAGELMADRGIALDVCFTSVLARAIRTADIALERAGQLWIPMVKSWRLNERHYGALTGLDKAQTARLHGEAQVKIWRRSYDIRPPALGPHNPWGFGEDRRYAGVATPAAESLEDTLERVNPCWEQDIAPRLRAHENVLIAAHGNSLRAIVKRLFAVGEEAIVQLEIPTGNPLLVQLDADLRPTAASYLEEERAEDLPPCP